jgi:hypothetical protein
MARVNNGGSDPRDKEIREVHRRYIRVMENERLAGIGDDNKTDYLNILKSLTEKLAIPSKPLSEIVSEIMAEAAPLLFRSLQR